MYKKNRLLYLLYVEVTNKKNILIVLVIITSDIIQKLSNLFFKYKSDRHQQVAV